MAEFPAIPLWTDAYLADTRHLTTLEHGAYLLLLMEAWRRPHCDLPDDDLMLARLAGLRPTEWDEVKPIVMSFWIRDKRRKVWTQKRLTKERSYTREKRQIQKDKAAKRWERTKKDDAAALPKSCPDDAPTPTPTPTPPKEETHSIECEGEMADFRLALDEPPPPPSLKPEHFVEVWNETASRLGRPCIRDLTPERRAQLKARINGHTIDDFREVLGKVEKSPFLRGEKAWGGATFDWLIKKSNFQKVLEGNYDG